MTDQVTAEIETLSAPHVLEYPYTRSVGPVIGHSLVDNIQRQPSGKPDCKRARATTVSAASAQEVKSS